MNVLMAKALDATGSGLERLWSRIGDVFSDFGILDAIDIILLTVIFMVAFSFIKGRKAGALIVGIILCGLIWLISFFLNLEGTYFIFSGVFQIGALALVVLFQPELRDALEKLGSGSISGIMHLGSQAKKKQLYYKAVDHICSAVGDLAANKTGALIVIQRTTNLEDVIESGVTINADVNSFLLRNLFFNKAPLHDGAVIIDEARIVAAGCLLPLTRRQDIDADLGTRHRAAIGMSETSDAIIIVVSEETGIISVAHDCELVRNYNIDTLRVFLMKRLLREDSGVGDKG